MRFVKSKGKRKDNTSFYRDRSMTQPFDLDQYLGKNGSDVANGGKGALTTSKRMKWVLGVSVFGAVAGIVLLAVVLFGWKPFDHIDEGNKGNLVDSEEVIHNYTNNNNEDSVVGNERYTNPIVYLAGQALYVCDEDGSKKVCLTEAALQSSSLLEYKNRANYMVSEDKRFVVYPEMIMYSEESSERTRTMLCIYDLVKHQIFKINEESLDFRITPENYLLLKSSKNNALCWVALNELGSYQNLAKDKESNKKEIQPERVEPGRENYIFDINESFVSEDGNVLVIVGTKSYSNGEEIEFVDPIFGKEGSSQFIVSMIDLHQQITLGEWADVHSYQLDSDKREVYFMREKQLEHISSNPQSKTINDVVYFYWDSDSDYLMYLIEKDDKMRYIKANDLVEDGQDDSNVDSLAEQEVFTYGIYDIVIEDQNKQIRLADVSINPKFMSVIDEQVVEMEVKRDVYKKLSMEEYTMYSDSIILDGTDDLLSNAFSKSYLIGTKLYSKSELEAERVLKYNKEKNQVIMYSYIDELNREGELYQKINKEGTNEMSAVSYILDLNSGKIIDYELLKDSELEYYGILGNKPLMAEYDVYSFKDRSLVYLYYGNKLIVEGALPDSIQMFESKEIVFIENYQELINSGDLFYCDENGEKHLIDTSVCDFSVTGNGMVYYCKTDATKDSLLYCFQDGSTRCLELAADLVLLSNNK